MSQRRLVGEVAIVTASTKGIGFGSVVSVTKLRDAPNLHAAIAKRLAQEGAHVVISSRRKDNVDEVRRLRLPVGLRQVTRLQAVGILKKEGLSVSGLVCHVGNEAHRAELINSTLTKYCSKCRRNAHLSSFCRFGKIDILVNNAAVNPYFGTLMTTPIDAWNKIMEVNVTAPFLLAREARSQPHPRVELALTGTGRWPSIWFRVRRVASFSLPPLRASALTRSSAPTRVRSPKRKSTLQTCSLLSLRHVQRTILRDFYHPLC